MEFDLGVLADVEPGHGEFVVTFQRGHAARCRRRQRLRPAAFGDIRRLETAVDLQVDHFQVDRVVRVADVGLLVVADVQVFTAPHRPRQLRVIVSHGISPPTRPIYHDYCGRGA